MNRLLLDSLRRDDGASERESLEPAHDGKHMFVDSKARCSHSPRCFTQARAVRGLPAYPTQTDTKFSPSWTHRSLAVLAAALTTQAIGADDSHKLGDHPAVVVQRLHANQGYDYASKFYPHPARLYLLPEEPHRMNDHPAVTIARQRADARVQALADARALLADEARQ